MNDFVLRGFCKKCEWQIYYSIKQKRSFHFIPEGLDYSKKYKNCQIEPVWFLSVKQMEIIQTSDEFSGDWMNKDTSDWDNSAKELEKFIQDNPFLVAKILKEAGKKENDKK